MAYVVHNLFSLALFAGLFYLVGRSVNRWLPAKSTVWDGVVGQMAIGAVTWIYVLFGLASVGLLRSEAVWATLGLFGVLLLIPRKAERAAMERVGGGLRLSGVFLSLIVGAIVIERFLQVISPGLAWDSTQYHLTVPRLWVENEGFRPIRFNRSSYLPLNVEMLFAMGLMLRDYVAAKIVHFLLGMLLLGAVYRLSRRYVAIPLALLASALTLANGVIFFELGTAYIDLGFALFVVVAFGYLLEALEQPNGGSSVWLAGVFCGAAAGAKVVYGFVPAFCLFLALLLLARRSMGPTRRAMRYSVAIALPTLLLALPWIIKALLYTGNPFYPGFYPLLGGPDWALELDRTFMEGVRANGMGRTFVDYLLLPIRVTLFGDWGTTAFDGRISPFWLLAVPLSLWWGRHRREVRLALGFSAIYFVIWALGIQQMRYLIPILPMLAFAAAVALGTRLEGVRPAYGKATMGAAILLVAATVATEHPYFRDGAGWSFERYPSKADELMDTATPTVFDFMNTELPRATYILFLNTNDGFFCEREYFADSSFDASYIAWYFAQFESIEEVDAAFDELGITHILFASAYWGIAYPDALSEYLQSPREVGIIFRSAKYVVLERR